MHPLSPASTHIYGVISMAFMARGVTLLTHCNITLIYVYSPLWHAPACLLEQIFIDPMDHRREWTGRRLRDVSVHVNL